MAAPIADQSVAEDTPLDVPGAGRCVLGCRQHNPDLHGTLSDGSALPAWLTFDALTRTFSGTPPLDSTDTLDLTVARATARSARPTRSA